jgi:hypothetical protein
MANGRCSRPEADAKVAASPGAIRGFLLTGGRTCNGFRRFRGGMGVRRHFDTSRIAVVSAQCELQFLPADPYI